MALKSTIYKCKLSVADLDRDYYQDHPLTIAQHPSETTERMLARILAFAHNADAELSFSAGLCGADEPDLMLKTLHDEVLLWIDIGQPESKKLVSACKRSKKVRLYNTAAQGARQWRSKHLPALAGFKNFEVYYLSDDILSKMATKLERHFELYVTIQETTLTVAMAGDSWEFQLS